MFRCLLVSVLALCAVSAGAMELSLEENRGISGSIGYVDIEKVFAEHPETLKAKEDFAKELAKREKAIERRKEEIYALKALLLKQKQECQFMRTLAEQFNPVSALAPADTAAVASTAALAATSTSAAQGSVSLPGDNISSATVQLAAEVSTTAAAAAAELPLSAQPQSLPKISSASLSQLELAVSEKERELDAKAIALKEFQKQAEKELLDMENRRTELILGKIYLVLRELTISESISVVVDKKSILYGQNAVDLTEKLIRRLRADSEMDKGGE